MSADRLGDVTRRVNASKVQILTTVAVALEGEIKDQLSRPGSGVTYKRGKNGTHQASAPGEPPAPDSNRLVNSIHHEVGGDSARVGTDEPYAKPLEFGTTTAGRGHHTVIAPRPFMRPALAAIRSRLTEDVKIELRDAASGGAA